ncbi:hypothetical protein CDAR_214191 [Caerostris darwini]|uniref:Uncharacterized protein n=1 Tax=Caerostris darwini TaxID=1538125 RepID=A0AAV4S367_9ARAC|nr:hypothetical protein CDAR_214191 [Caerostris darwini]
MSTPSKVPERRRLRTSIFSVIIDVGRRSESLSIKAVTTFRKIFLRSFLGQVSHFARILPDSPADSEAQNPELIRRPPDFCSLFGPTPAGPRGRRGEKGML